MFSRGKREVQAPLVYPLSRLNQIGPEDQEQEMDDLSAKLKTLQGDEAKSRAAYDDYLANLSAE